MTRWLPVLGIVGIVLAFASATVEAQQAGPAAAPVTIVQTHPLPPIGAPAPPFDPAKATNAYLARVSGQEKARSDSYFEGGYWLILVDTLWALAISALLLWSRLSAAVRDFAERQTRSAFWQVPLYAGPYILLTTAMTLPIALAARRFGSLERIITGVTGVISLGFGLFLIYQHGIADPTLIGAPGRGAR